jgi:itaconate CoA-transferase
VLGQPALADDPRLADNTRRAAHRAELDAAIEAVLATLTAEALTERLQRARIAYGAVNSVADLGGHPRLRRIEVGSPTGPVSMPAPPARFASAPAPSVGASPALGQHDAAIRAEFAA